MDHSKSHLRQSVISESLPQRDMNSSPGDRSTNCWDIFNHEMASSRTVQSSIEPGHNGTISRADLKMSCTGVKFTIKEDSESAQCGEDA